MSDIDDKIKYWRRVIDADTLENEGPDYFRQILDIRYKKTQDELYKIAMESEDETFRKEAARSLVDEAVLIKLLRTCNDEEVQKEILLNDHYHDQESLNELYNLTDSPELIADIVLTIENLAVLQTEAIEHPWITTRERCVAGLINLNASEKLLNELKPKLIDDHLKKLIDKYAGKKPQ